MPSSENRMLRCIVGHRKYLLLDVNLNWCRSTPHGSGVTLVDDYFFGTHNKENLYWVLTFGNSEMGVEERNAK
ncbi:hypothetical protein [Chengkuizengella axinellae]|uniref:Uncharacterized protein n=1 Tax=Chengkuizengella axinellae TaxID=3064388 RepID=A0ABT9ITK8_9BACL|nr:hypothetical protein [Chengkuizengella sp. 2205SS18-9]MDP5272691.1 hypothetical protein [Chengkuizengella sp. 2205SS18-9]